MKDGDENENENCWGKWMVGGCMVYIPECYKTAQSTVLPAETEPKPSSIQQRSRDREESNGVAC